MVLGGEEIMQQSLINSIAIAVLAACMTFLATWFWLIRKARQDAIKDKLDAEEKLKQRISDLETQHALLKQAVLPISTAFQAILIKELTHYHTPEMDSLMVKLGPPNVLTQEEEDRLITLLDQRTQDLDGRIGELERDAATMLPLVMKRVKVEDMVEVSSHLEIVSIPDSEGDKEKEE